jgi:hypothetical protein
VAGFSGLLWRGSEDSCGGVQHLYFNAVEQQQLHLRAHSLSVIDTSMAVITLIVLNVLNLFGVLCLCYKQAAVAADAGLKNCLSHKGRHVPFSMPAASFVLHQVILCHKDGQCCGILGFATAMSV